MVLWNYGKKYGTIEKNYDTILRTMELHFTKENDIVDYQKTKKISFIMEKQLWYCGKNYGTMKIAIVL